MAPVVVDPAAIRSFADAAALERWYRTHQARDSELWLRLYKAGSGIASVSAREALDVALCWGWIDAIRKAYDAESFLQRYTRRRTTSSWSKANIANVERLGAAGRMQPPGEAEVALAKADGRWERAYAGSKDMEFPADLAEAIAAVPEAQATFERLTAQNRFALAYRVSSLKTAEGRRKRIAAFVEMLRAGDTIYPQSGVGRE